MTAEQLERVDIPGKSTELVRGRLVVHEPPGTFHGQVAATLLVHVGMFVQSQELGRVFAQDTGFRIFSNPDTVRAPDVAFVAAHRTGGITPRGYAALAPDLVAEILSPGDSRSEVVEKTRDWLAAGVRIVWIIDPELRTAEVHRGDGTSSTIAADGALDGEIVLPGFILELSELYR